MDVRIWLTLAVLYVTILCGKDVSARLGSSYLARFPMNRDISNRPLLQFRSAGRFTRSPITPQPLDDVVINVDEIMRQPTLGDTYERKRLVVRSAMMPPDVLTLQDTSEVVVQYEYVEITVGFAEEPTKFLLVLTNSSLRCYVHAPSENIYFPLPDVAVARVPFATKMALTRARNRATGEEHVYCAVAQAESNDLLENQKMTFFVVSELGLTLPKEHVMQYPFQNFLFLDSADGRNPVLAIIHRNPSTFDVKWIVEYAEFIVGPDNTPSISRFDEFLVDDPKHIATSDVRGAPLVAIDSAAGYIDVGISSKTAMDVLMFQHLVVTPDETEEIVDLSFFKYRSMPILAVSFKQRTTFFAFDAGNFSMSHTVAVFPGTEIAGFKSATFVDAGEGLLYVRAVTDKADPGGRQTLEFWRLYFVQDQLTSEYLNVAIDCAQQAGQCDKFDRLDLERSSAVFSGSAIEFALVHGDATRGPVILFVNGSLVDVEDPALVTVKEDAIWRDTMSHKATEALKLVADIKAGMDSCVRNASDVIGNDYLSFTGDSFVGAMDVTGTVHALQDVISQRIELATTSSSSAILAALKAAVLNTTAALNELQAKLDAMEKAAAASVIADRHKMLAKCDTLLIIDGAEILNDVLVYGESAVISGTKTFINRASCGLMKIRGKLNGGDPTNFALRSNVSFTQPVTFQSVNFDRNIELPTGQVIRAESAFGGQSAFIPTGSLVPLAEPVLFDWELTMQKSANVDNLYVDSTVTVDGVALQDFMQSVVLVNGPQRVITAPKDFYEDVSINNGRFTCSKDVLINGCNITDQWENGFRLRNGHIKVPRLVINGDARISGALSTNLLNDAVPDTALQTVSAQTLDMGTLERIAGSLNVEDLTVTDSMCGQSFPGQFVPLNSPQPLTLANKILATGLSTPSVNVVLVNGIKLDDVIASLSQLKNGSPTAEQFLIPEGLALTVRDSVVFSDSFNGKQVPEVVSSVVFNETSEVVEFPFLEPDQIIVKNLAADEVSLVSLNGSSSLRDVFMMASESQIIRAPVNFASGLEVTNLEVPTINGFTFAPMETFGVRCDDTSATVLSNVNFINDVIFTRVLELNHTLNGIPIPRSWVQGNSYDEPFETPVTVDLLTVNFGNVSVNSPEENKEMMKYLEDRVKLRSDEVQLISTHMNITGLTSLDLKFAHFWDFPPTRLLEKFLRKGETHNFTGLSSFKRIRTGIAETFKGISGLKLTDFVNEAIFTDKPVEFRATMTFEEAITVDNLSARKIQNVDLLEVNASLCFTTSVKCVFIDTAAKSFTGTFVVNPASNLLVLDTLNQKPIQNLLTNATGKDYIMTGLWTFESTKVPVRLVSATVNQFVGPTANAFTMLTLKALAGVNGNSLQGISVNGATAFKFPIIVVNDLACNTIDGKPLGPAQILSRIDLTQDNVLNMLLRLNAGAAVKGTITARYVNGQDWSNTVFSLFLNNSESTAIQAPQTMTQLSAGLLVVKNSIQVGNQVHGVPVASLPCIRLDQQTNTETLRLHFSLPVDVSDLEVGSLQGPHTEVPPDSLIRIQSPCPPDAIDMSPLLSMGKANVTGGRFSALRVNGIDNLASTLDNLVLQSSPVMQTVVGHKVVTNHTLQAPEGLTATKICPADPAKCVAEIGCKNPSDFISVNPADYASGIVRIPGPVKFSQVMTKDLTVTGYVNGIPGIEPISTLLRKNRPVTLNGNWIITGPLEMNCGTPCDANIYLGPKSIKQIADAVQAVQGKLEEKARRLDRELNELCHTWALVTRGAGGKLELLDSFEKQFRCRGFSAPIKSVVLFEVDALPNLLVCSNDVPATLSPSQAENCQFCLLFAGEAAFGDIKAERGVVATLTGVVNDMASTYFGGRLMVAAVTEPSSRPKCHTVPKLTVWMYDDSNFKMLGSVDLAGISEKVVLKNIGNQLRAFVAVGGDVGAIIAYQVDIDFALGSATLRTVGARVPSNGKFAVETLWDNDEPLALTVTEDTKGVVLSMYDTYGNSLTTVPSNTSYPAAAAVAAFRSPFGSFAALAIPGTQQQIPVKSNLQLVRLKKDGGWHVNKYHALDVSGAPVHIDSFLYSPEAAYVLVAIEKEMIEVIQTKGASGFGRVFDIGVRGLAKLSSNVTLGKDVYVAAWTDDRTVHMYKTRALGESNPEQDVCRVLVETTNYTSIRPLRSPIVSSYAVTQNLEALALPLTSQLMLEPNVDLGRVGEQMLRSWIINNLKNSDVTKQVVEILSTRGKRIPTSFKTDLNTAETPKIETLAEVAMTVKSLQSRNYQVVVAAWKPDLSNLPIDDTASRGLREILRDLGVVPPERIKFLIKRPAKSQQDHVYSLEAEWST